MDPSCTRFSCTRPYFFASLRAFQYAFIAALFRMLSRARVSALVAFSALMSRPERAACILLFVTALCSSLGVAALFLIQHALQIFCTCNLGRQKVRMPLVMLHSGQVWRGLFPCIDVVFSCKGCLWVKLGCMDSLRPLNVQYVHLCPLPKKIKGHRLYCVFMGVVRLCPLRLRF